MGYFAMNVSSGSKNDDDDDDDDEVDALEGSGCRVRGLGFMCIRV